MINENKTIFVVREMNAHIKCVKESFEEMLSCFDFGEKKEREKFIRIGTKNII